MAELSIKRCTCVNNRCIRSKISRYNLDRGRVEFGAIATPTGSRWMSNNYITGCQRRRELVGVSYLEFELQFEAVGTSSQQRACGPQWPPVEQPSRMRKKCCYSQGSICCSLFRLQLTSHTQPFRNPFENKVWEEYFSIEVCPFVIIVDFVSTYICICIVVSWLYNTCLKKKTQL